MSATGYAFEHLPDGLERDEILGLLRIGVKFSAQHVGRRRGFFARYLETIAGRIEAPLNFDRLLIQLELEAVRRNRLGPDVSPVERVDREWALLTWHDPQGRRRQTPFGTIRNHLTEIKKRR